MTGDHQDSRWKPFLRPLLLAGLVAGTLDLVAAIAVNLPRDIPPIRILQSIASGLLGRDAYTGGMATAVLGTALHFGMMFVIAAVFLAASRQLQVLRRHWMASGVLYGIGVYVVMNYIVLPLSAFPHERASDLSRIAAQVLIHMSLVGLPIAWIAKRDPSGQA